MICLVPSTHVLSYDCVALRAAGIHVLGPDYAGSSALCRPDGLVRCIAHFPITHVLGRFRCCPRHSGDSAAGAHLCAIHFGNVGYLRS